MNILSMQFINIEVSGDGQFISNIREIRYDMNLLKKCYKRLENLVLSNFLDLKESHPKIINCLLFIKNCSHVL